MIRFDFSKGLEALVQELNGVGKVVERHKPSDGKEPFLTLMEYSLPPHTESLHVFTPLPPDT